MLVPLHGCRTTLHPDLAPSALPLSSPPAAPHQGTCHGPTLPSAGTPGTPLLKAAAALLSSSALPPRLASRLLDVLLTGLAAAASAGPQLPHGDTAAASARLHDPALAVSWLLSLLFGPQHGQVRAAQQLRSTKCVLSGGGDTHNGKLARATLAARKQTQHYTCAGSPCLEGHAGAQP